VEPVVGVTKDLKKAVEYFEKAKQWGYAPASNACKYPNRLERSKTDGTNDMY
jgi:TPR repeat protein